MLSLRILCAVDIINTLHTHYRLNGRGLKKSDIVSQGCMPTNMYNPVLCELSRSRIIERKTSSVYYFDKSLSEVSLYDLSNILHQGVPIGEIVTTKELRGSLIFKDQFQPLVCAEKALVDDVSRQMQNMKLSDLLRDPSYHDATLA